LADPPAPVGAVRALDRLHVLPGDQVERRDRLGGHRAQFLVGQMAEQPVRVTDQRVDQLGAGLLVVPGDRRLARIVVVMGRSTARRSPRRRRGLRDAPAGSPRSTASPCPAWRPRHRGSSNDGRVFPFNTPVSATTALTASKIRSGRSEAASRRRQYVNVVAWNAAAVTGRPHAAFHRRSNVSASTVSASDKPHNSRHSAE
jgi:hypothetical protein